MKSTVSKTEKPPQKAYPCLKISKQNRLVLFTSKGLGVCLHDPSNNWRLGEHGGWAEDDCFEPFSGTVTISSDDVQ